VAVSVRGLFKLDQERVPGGVRRLARLDQLVVLGRGAGDDLGCAVLEGDQLDARVEEVLGVDGGAN